MKISFEKNGISKKSKIGQKIDMKSSKKKKTFKKTSKGLNHNLEINFKYCTYCTMLCICGADKWCNGKKSGRKKKKKHFFT